jgi:CheY-like chemotaxis protein
VIFLTAYSEDATLQRAKLAEPFGYLLKPFEDRELKSAMEIALYKHRAEEEIRRFSRLYDVLSQINQMVVRSNSRDELLAGACRFLVERGAIDAAWIGWLDQDGTRLAPVACFGQCGQLLAQADFPADRGPAGWGDPGQALAEGKPHLCAQCGGKACLYAGDKALASPGFQSCASFPLTFQGRVSGALCVCVRDKYFFGEREVALLKEVAGDIPWTRSRATPSASACNKS